MDIFGNPSNMPGDKEKRYLVTKEESDFSYADAMTEGLAKIEEKETLPYISAIKFFIALLFIALVVKLFSLQIVFGSDNQKLAEGNRIRPRIIEASRGLITDKDGVWLARNKPDYALSIYPSDLPKKSKDREEALKKISDITGVSYSDLKKSLAKKGNYFLDSIIIKEHLNHDEALLMEEKVAELPETYVSLQSSREYAAVPGMGHILGYTGIVSPDDIKSNKSYLLSDKVGKTGLEKSYESDLRGTHGLEQIEVDSKGNILRVLVKDGSINPVPGNDLSLYLDRGLQEKSVEALKKGMENARTVTGNGEINSGAVVVMDVKTGGILSLVSLPDYDNNIFSTAVSEADYKNLIEDKSQPLFDRAITGTYPPGSISKIILATAGLAEGTITPNTSFDTPPEIKIGDYVFPDWKDHGITNVTRALAESNNVFFYSVGGGFDKIKGIGIDKIKKWWELFGLGSPTGIDLPNESSGLLPDPAWKEKVKNEPWYIGDTYHVSIGQGDLLVTPLQMVRATATIANGGKLLKPQLVKKITDSSGNVIKEFKPLIQRENFARPEVIQTVQTGMRMAVTEGSARALKSLPVTSAGKTGTAQFLNNQKTHAWFEAYAPYENPEIAIVVLIEGGGGGNETALPVAQDILNYYFSR
jgi:penicillin-binding protein 2